MQASNLEISVNYFHKLCSFKQKMQNQHDLIDPTQKLNEILFNGAEVWVDLSTRVELSNRGVPRISHWRNLAFAYNNETVKRRNKEETERKRKLKSAERYRISNIKLSYRNDSIF